MKNIIFVIAFIVTLLFAGASSFAYSDVQSESSYADAVNQMAKLDIIKGFTDGTFKPNVSVTREQFAALMIKCAALTDIANAADKATVFPDVLPVRWSSSIINVAVNKGYVKGMPDGYFCPEQAITFGQVCTVLVRALGYTADTDVVGIWPYSYVSKAQEILLTENLTYSANDKLPRWAIALMLSRLIETNIKKSNPLDADKTFATASNFYTTCTILGNATTMDNLAVNQVYTDKGIYYCPAGADLVVGSKYKLKMEEDRITKVFDTTNSIKTVEVVAFDENKLTFGLNGIIDRELMSDKTIYYYNGIKQTYDNLKNTIIKGGSIVLSLNENKSGYEFAVVIDPPYKKLGQYTECVVIDNATTSSKLENGQIRTDKGFYFLPKQGLTLELGCRYALVINGDKIVQSLEKLNSAEKITIQSATNETITYKVGTTEKSMTLPENTTYYYEGVKQIYSVVKNLIQQNTAIIMVKNSARTGYEYALIIDPVHSKSEVAMGYVPSSGKIGSIDLTGDVSIVKNSEIISASEIAELDVVTNVTDFWNENRFVLVTDTKISGEIFQISPSKLSPVALQIDAKNYSLSKDVNMSKINTTTGSFHVGDKVTVALDYEGNVIDVFSYSAQFGPYTECIILADSRILDTLTERQVQTDKGIVELADASTPLGLGNTYQLYLDDNVIVKVGEVLKTVKNISVNNIFDNTLTYKENGVTKSMQLNEGTSYYYKGEKQTFTAMKSLMQVMPVNTSIIFVYNNNMTAFDTAIVIDPVISAPQVVLNPDLTNYIIGSIKFNYSTPIIKDGAAIALNQVLNYDVVYEINDFWGENTYLLDVRSAVYGYILSVSPNELAPNSIKLTNNVTYELSRYLNIDTINNSPSAFKVGDFVRILLGSDGKVVYIYQL